MCGVCESCVCVFVFCGCCITDSVINLFIQCNCAELFTADPLAHTTQTMTDLMLFMCLHLLSLK